MIDNEFENYYLLYNNLIEEEKNYMKNYIIKTESHKREDIITQLLADKGGFRINNDPSLFYEQRKIVYLKIKVTKNSEIDNIVKVSTLIRNERNFNTTIELDGTSPKISFEININKENYINIYNESNQPVSFYNSPMGQSENLSKISTGKKSSSSNYSNQSKKNKVIINNSFDFIFRDQTHGDDTYFITIKQRSHEIDGSLIANNTINDLKSIVGNIIYYPRDIESKPIQIVKNQKVFIEIKQNTTLLKLFGQMKKLIEDIYEICEENYLYLGFVNKAYSLESFSKDDKNEENNFITEIKTTIEKYKKFNICLLIIENNEFLGNSLEDRADYPLYYYNLTSQQIDNKINALETKIDNKINALETKIDNKINALETKIDNKIKGIQTEIKGIQTEVKGIQTEVKGIKNDIDGMKNKINDIDSKMEKILDALSNKIGTKNNNSSGQNSINLSDNNKGSEANKESKNSNDDSEKK